MQGGYLQLTGIPSGGGGKGFFSLFHGIIWNNLWLDGPLDPNVDTTHPTC